MGDSIVVLLSGGLDSTAMMAWAKRARGMTPMPISFNYGQRHDREINAARAVADFYDVGLHIFDLRDIFGSFSGCLIDGSEIPKGMTYEELKASEGIAQTYVPFRNGILLSIAAAYAYDNGIDLVGYGAHATDARGGAYPDCTRDFAFSMAGSITHGTADKVRLATPFLTMTKGEVLRTGLRLGAPIHLTWSCYMGEETPCLECPTCLERAEAFRFNNLPDLLLGG